MKESIGGIPIFQIAIIFILAFAGIMCLTINHSKAFGVKDEIINIIDSNEYGGSSGLSQDTVDKIIEKFNEVGYRVTGTCPDGWIGYDLNGNTSSNPVFCVESVNVVSGIRSDIQEKCGGGKCTPTNANDFPTMVYHNIALFYQLDIPILNKLMNFRLYGSTKMMIGG